MFHTCSFNVTWLVTFMGLYVAGGIFPAFLVVLMRSGSPGFVGCDWDLVLKVSWKVFSLLCGGVFGAFEINSCFRLNILGSTFFLMILLCTRLCGVMLDVEIVLRGILGFNIHI